MYGVSQVAALGAAMIPGAQPLVPALELASLGTAALSGTGRRKKVPRYALMAKKNF